MNSISFAAFDEWLSRQPELIQEHAFFDEADAFEDIGVQFHTGDWTGEVLTAAPVTVIDGNVSVGKISWDYDLGLLLITGNLHCEHIGRLGIDLVVGGDLIAKTCEAGGHATRAEPWLGCRQARLWPAAVQAVMDSEPLTWRSSPATRMGYP